MIKKIIFSVIVVAVLVLSLYSCTFMGGTCKAKASERNISLSSFIDQSDLENDYYNCIIDCGNALYKDSSYSIQNYMSVDSLSLMPINTEYNMVDNIPKPTANIYANEFIVFLPYATTYNNKTVIALDYFYLQYTNVWEEQYYYQLSNIDYNIDLGFTINTNSTNMNYVNASVTLIKVVTNGQLNMVDSIDINQCKSFIYMTNGLLCNAFQFYANDVLKLTMYVYLETDYAYTISSNERIYQPLVNVNYQYAFRNYYDLGFENGRTYGYELGFNEGESLGFENGRTYGYELGFNEGESLGFENGYNVGYSQGQNDILTNSPFKVISSGMNDFLSIELLPNIKIGYLIAFGIGIMLLMILLKVFR